MVDVSCVGLLLDLLDLLGGGLLDLVTGIVLGWLLGLVVGVDASVSPIESQGGRTEGTEPCATL